VTDRDALEATLESLVPPFDHDEGSWDDVLRRAETATDGEGMSAPAVAAAPGPPAGSRRPRPPRRPLLRPLLGLVGVLAITAAIATPPGRAASAWVGGLVGIGEVGGPPTRHDIRVGGKRGKPFVIATGRAPDGARYELVLDRYPGGIEIADGEPADSCIQLEWPHLPRAGVTSGFCGPGFPPPQERGRAPGGAAARPFGFLTPYEVATRYLVLEGFTEPSVARVRVLYTVRPGVRRDAAVDLIELSNDIHERIGSVKAVDVFVAFLPRSAANFDWRKRSQSLEVLAYDRRGSLLGSVRHTDLANATERPIPRRGR
jgi:hypothetical protein